MSKKIPIEKGLEIQEDPQPPSRMHPNIGGIYLPEPHKKKAPVGEELSTAFRLSLQKESKSHLLWQPQHLNIMAWTQKQKGTTSADV